MKWCVMTVLSVVLALALVGCQKPLFPANAQQTQYERYAELHGEEHPQTKTNVYGGQEPDLRERLKPLGEP